MRLKGASILPPLHMNGGEGRFVGEQEWIRSPTLPMNLTERGSVTRSNFASHIVAKTNGNAFKSGACCGSQSRAPVQGFEARNIVSAKSLPTRARGEREKCECPALAGDGHSVEPRMKTNSVGRSAKTKHR